FKLTMPKKSRLTTALGLVCSLLLAPWAWAQQEIIDPQPAPEAGSQSLPHSATPPATSPPPTEQAPPKTEPSAPPVIAFSTSKPTLQGALLSISTLLGTTIKTSQGEEVGKLQDFMVDPLSGRIRSAVLSFGGTLGVGEKRVTIPWENLTVSI